MFVHLFFRNVRHEIPLMKYIMSLPTSLHCAVSPCLLHFSVIFRVSKCVVNGVIRHRQIASLTIFLEKCFLFHLPLLRVLHPFTALAVADLFFLRECSNLSTYYLDTGMI